MAALYPSLDNSAPEASAAPVAEEIKRTKASWKSLEDASKLSPSHDTGLAAEACMSLQNIAIHLPFHLDLLL